MPLDSPTLPIADQVAALNERFRGAGASDILAAALDYAATGRIALVSSFGADSVVLLHLAAQVDRNLPVLFIDTQMLFAETLDYQKTLAETLGLTDLRVIRPDPAEVLARDADNLLHLTDPDACCTLRKTEPLDNALAPFGAWITGRKRHQGAERAALEHFEADADGRIKVNPLAHWRRDDLAAHIDRHDLPRHPLVAKGFTSIGCSPCTTPVREGEDARAGRWRGRDKIECGIHFIGGKLVRVERTGDAA